MTNTQIDVIISRYLSGEATPEEQDDFRKWILSDSNNREEFDKLASIYQHSKAKWQNEQKQRVFEKLQQRISESKTQSPGKSIYPKHYLRMVVSMAAAMFIIFTLGFLYYINNAKTPEKSLESNSMMIKSNPIGQKSKVFLPDGSIVWLNSASTLSYEKDFNDSIRYLILEGEAFFEVQKDANRPFIVQSGQISTTALGTSFNIQAYSGEELVVALIKGSVNVAFLDKSANVKDILLEPGEGVLYNPSEDSKELNKINISVPSAKSWKDGQLQLSNASLPTTVKLLQRWYGVEIQCTNAPEDSWSVNGTFDNEYLENVLNSLSFSYGFEYKINDKKVYINFK